MSEPITGQPPVLSPLLPSDPPKVDQYWLDARICSAVAGVAYTAHDNDSTPAMVIFLAEGAANDPAARDRFTGTINQLHIDTVLARGGQGQDEGRLRKRFRDQPQAPQIGDDAPTTPWVALAFDGSLTAANEASRILAEVDLSVLGQQRNPSGPDYRLHWVDRFQPGIAKIWPLPWPGRQDRAGWGSILVAWLLMLLACALAVLIAILLFQNSPPEQPPPPVPTTVTTPSPQSASPSPESASPQTPPPSGDGSPTPNSKL